MTHRISFRSYLTGAVAVAALMINAPTATAQTPPTLPTPEAQQSRVSAALDEVMTALDKSPKLKKMSAAKKRELVEFTLGNTLFVMAHEMGHVLISEMNLPTLGKEEDAADSFAVLFALQLRSAFSERVLYEAAKGLVLSSFRDKQEGNALAFYDEHGLDLQRAYSVVCLMVGSDPEKFKSLAKETKLPEERQKSCVRDYKTSLWSWETVLKPYRRSADQPKVAISVEYQDDEDYAIQAGILRKMRLLEAFAERAAENFAWPAPFAMVARSCGVPNATWNIGKKTITLCYELLEEFSQLYQGFARKLPTKKKTSKR